MVKNLNEAEISATGTKILMKDNPGATSIIENDILDKMPKGIAADEALRLVPGVRIDNPSNGSDIHLSVRGQGILTERGLRGIKVLIDGIPVNDPTGFAPDLYDVDWSTVRKIEVLRGSAASSYNAGATAGVLNISTYDGGVKQTNGMASMTYGSNAFWKALGQIDGTSERINYRISYSRSEGNGYRDHTYFNGDNFYEKINWKVTDKFKLTQIFSLTQYFNQNPGGINKNLLVHYRTRSNPDAIPFNQYQQTNRITNGLTGIYNIKDNQNINFSAYYRATRYKETTNLSAQYKDFMNPGANVQYNLNFGSENFKHHFGIGSDIMWQTIKKKEYKSLKDTNRIDDHNQNNLENKDSIRTDQLINQRAIGAYLFDKIDIFKSMNLTFNLRYDNIHNSLEDRMLINNTHINQSGNKDYNKLTSRIGLTIDVFKNLNFYANWGIGFLPPATEELAVNPKNNLGFNENLKPSTSQTKEIGFRGLFNKTLYYDLNGFIMDTKNDFYRYKDTKLTGNQEVCYGNTGNTSRYGIESYLAYTSIEPFKIQLSYTFSMFKYTTPDSIKDYFLPNSPVHQLYAEVDYNLTKQFSIGIETQWKSKWHIYTDSTLYNKLLDNGTPDGKGVNIFNVRLTYSFNLFKVKAEVSFYIKNLTDEEYMGYTEPDFNGNSYHPAAKQEYFGNLKIRF